MQLVQHDIAQGAEEAGAVAMAQHQRKLFRRGEEDVGRHALLALAFRRGRVAGAGLDIDRQADTLDRRLQIALDVRRQRLERRDVERVDATCRTGCPGHFAASLMQFDE